MTDAGPIVEALRAELADARASAAAAVMQLTEDLAHAGARMKALETEIAGNDERSARIARAFDETTARMERAAQEGAQRARTLEDQLARTQAELETTRRALGGIEKAHREQLEVARRNALLDMQNDAQLLSSQVDALKRTLAEEQRRRADMEHDHYVAIAKLHDEHRVAMDQVRADAARVEMAADAKLLAMEDSVLPLGLSHERRQHLLAMATSFLRADEARAKKRTQ